MYGMSRTKVAIGVCAVAACVATAVLCLWPHGGGSTASGDPAAGGSRSTDKPRSARGRGWRKNGSAARPRPPSARKSKPVVFDAGAGYVAAISPEERALLQELQAALDSDDFNAVKRASEKIRAYGDAAPRAAGGSSSGAESGAVSMRRKAIEALGWFGSAALPELTAFLGDSDAETAQEALSRWEEAVADVDDELEKAKIVILASQVLEDADALDAIQMHLAMMGDEGIACQACLDILDIGTDAAKLKAKEQLDFITGEEFETVEQVHAWIDEYNKNNSFFELEDEAAGQ